MEIPDYSEYGFEDFLMDADFRAWVTQPTPELDAFWQEFAATHPAKRRVLNEAIWAIQHLSIQPYPLPDAAKTRIWQQLDTRYRQLHSSDDAADTTPVIPLPTTRRRWLWAAASLTGTLLLAAGTWYAVRSYARTTVTTDYAQTKEVVLPDQTTVTLNRNSSVSYVGNWSDERPREVWVTGEAFFAVRRRAAAGATQATRPGDNFVVHTDLMNVEVLGTQFDINTRRGKAHIVLNEGKVKLVREQAGVQESLLMQPGDRVDVSREASGFVKRRVDAARYEDWRNGQLRFEQTPIRDIVAILEDTYGWQITIRNRRFAQQTFTAMVPADQPDVLLNLLTESFGIHIHRRGPIITID